MTLDATLHETRIIHVLIRMAARWCASPEELRAILRASR